MEKWHTEHLVRNMLILTDEFNTPDAKLPEYLFLLPCEQTMWYLRIRLDSMYTAWVKKDVLKYYDHVMESFYWNRSKYRSELSDHSFMKDIYRLKPEFRHRMITKGYQDSATKSMGKYFDIERAFQGWPGPLTAELRADFR